MAAAYPDEVLEHLEQAILAITPSETAGSEDVFQVLDGDDVEDLTQVSRDRRFIVTDSSVVSRKAGSGGCVLATMEVDVSVGYGIGRESRRRRVRDEWRIENALRDARPTLAAIKKITIGDPQPHTLLAGDQGSAVIVTWSLTVEFYTHEEG